MKKLFTVICILGIILIISSQLFAKNTALSKAQQIYSKNSISNLKKQDMDSLKTLPTINETLNNQQDNTTLEILPTVDSGSDAKNQVWAGVFQLIWDDLAQEINKGPIIFEGSQPEMANLLNKSSFSAKDLSTNAYYKKLGLVSPQLKLEIEEAIWNKFREKSRILDSFNWTPAPEKYILYAMLKKDLEYVEKFNKLDDDYFKGSDSPVKYFGVTADKASRIKESVNILFYNNYNDFAVTLKSKQGDLIHLYRTDNKQTLSKLYTEMKQQAIDGKNPLRANDKFKAPVLDFNAQREFRELYNKTIIPSGFEIDRAIEAIKFKMDEVGVKLVAEAAITVGRGAMVHSGRNFYFTGPYAIFMEEPGKNPYFAAYITDPASLN